MNPSRIIGIVVLLIGVFALAVVASTDRPTLERVVLFLLPTMGMMLGLLIAEEIREARYNLKK